MIKKLLCLLVLLLTATTGAWATTPNSIVINGTPQVGDKSISLTYYFNPANVPGITSFVPTLKVKCAADNKWDEMNLSLSDVSSGTTNISLNTLGEFEAGKTYEVCFAYYNGTWEDDVFQSFVPAGPATYAVTLAEGTEDASNWQGKAGEGAYQELPLEGVAANTAVSVKYNGTKKVKSVKAVKKADNAYLKWDEGQEKLVATEIPSEVTTVQNSNENVEWAAGTYVVEGEVTINGKIYLTGNVDLIIKDGAKLTATRINSPSNDKKNLSIYGQSKMNGELVINSTSNFSYAIDYLSTLSVHSAKVTANSTSPSSGGIFAVETINVYGGLLDAKYTGSDGYGIFLSGGGKMNIYGGEVKAASNGTGANSYGIMASTYDSAITVTVYGGKLWAESPGNTVFNTAKTTFAKGGDFSGKIETSSDGTSWTEYTSTGTPDAKYVRAGY